MTRLLLIGHGRHGKDTVADMFKSLSGFTWASSSWTAASEVVIPYMVRNGIAEYDSVDACFQDRHAMRGHWFDAIDQFNTPDKTRLARYIMDRNDMYVGMRSPKELWACKAAGLFDAIVWVDASEREPLEGKSSMRIERHEADFVIDNNGALEETRFNVQRLIEGQGWVPDAKKS